MLKNTILVSRQKVKRIAITCKCEQRFVEMVPGEVVDGGAIPVFQCPSCGQQYVIRDDQLQRIPDLHSLIGLKDPKVEDGPINIETGDQETVDPNAWAIPHSKSVN